MKKAVLFLSVAIAGSTMFTSCTKSIKDDLSDLQQKVDTLSTRVDSLEVMLGANEPIGAVTTFEDNDGVTRKIEARYKFKSVGYYTQSLEKNSDGTYDIYIERFGDISWEEGAWVSFTYDPATKALTHKRGGQYWEDNDQYYDRTYFDEDYYTTGLTINITLNRIDVTTGDISLNFSAKGTGEWSSYTWDAPNNGKASSTDFSFTGKLQLFTEGE